MSLTDYGFLSDCEVSALVAPSGNVEWMCLPRMDGPSVFAAMLDRGAGWFRLGPADVMVPSGQRYLPGTMVLETTWGSPTGWAVVRDVLLVGPWRHDSARSGTQRRSCSGACTPWAWTVVGVKGERLPEDQVEAELAERRRHWTPPPRHSKGILSLYARVARGSSDGASIT
jgi:trehalase-like protein